MSRAYDRTAASRCSGCLELYDRSFETVARCLAKWLCHERSEVGKNGAAQDLTSNGPNTKEIRSCSGNIELMVKTKS